MFYSILNKNSGRNTVLVVWTFTVISSINLVSGGTEKDNHKMKDIDITHALDEEVPSNNGKSAIPANSTGNSTWPWTFRCEFRMCLRFVAKPNERLASLDVCWLTCAKPGALWPYPNRLIHLGKETVPFQPHGLEFMVDHVEKSTVHRLIDDAIHLYYDRLKKMAGITDMFQSQISPFGERNNITVLLGAEGNSTVFSFDTDEQYQLNITSLVNPGYNGSMASIKIDAVVRIRGKSYFGLRNGLETLMQLIAYDEVHRCLQMTGKVRIRDKPAFPYRGLMIDTARHFIPISSLKRMVDGMSYNKLNIFHWHLTDSNSFPFYSKKVPQMTQYGSYSPSEIYYPEEVKEFVEYARVRGVKIIPELNTPAHAGNGWQWGRLQDLNDLAICTDQDKPKLYCKQPPCGHMNPLNFNTYSLLGRIYEDMLSVFDNDIFHMGGDEVNLDCWTNHSWIKSFVRNNQKELTSLWGFFQEHAYKRLKEANKNKTITAILWSSNLTANIKELDRLSRANYIIQFRDKWNTEQMKYLMRKKFRLIYSVQSSLFLSNGFGSENYIDKPPTKYVTWKSIYELRLKKILQNGTKPYKFTLGAEAPLFSEQVNENNMDMKLWPRGSALAENLWSDPEKSYEDTYARLIHHNRRMIKQGIHANPQQSENCLPMFGSCY